MAGERPLRTTGLRSAWSPRHTVVTEAHRLGFPVTGTSNGGLETPDA